MNNTITCPLCNLKHTFSSNLINEIICSNCQVGLKQNVDYTQMAPNPYPDMPNDGSKLSLKAKIIIENETYLVIGKLRFQLTNTIISRWILLTKDGSIKYLFEFINGYAIANKYQNIPEKYEITNIKPLKKLDIVGYEEAFQVNTIYKNFNTTAIGELDSNTIDFENFECIELSNSKDEFAFIQSGFDKKLLLFTGHFVPFSDLKIQADSKTLFVSPTYNCPKCDNVLSNQLFAKAISIVCGKCKSHFTFEKDQSLKFNNQFKKPSEIDIPLGSQGIIEGKTYNIIGYLLKREEGTSYKWKEYFLRDIDGKISTLSEFNGHYNLIQEIKFYGDIKNTDSSLKLNGTTYHLYNKYTVDLEAAEGEFSYQIMQDSNFKVKEFIAPPFIFFYESTNHEARFYKGQSILPKQVEKAFEQAEIQPQVGIGAAQTMFLGVNYSFFIRMCILFFALLIAVQVFFTSMSSNKRIYNQTFTQGSVNDSTKVLITNTFQITNAPTALQFDLVSNVYNNWFGITIELINDNTGERFEVDKTVEFYSGVDGGESWSEGSRSESVFMSQVPAGNYHINLYPEWGSINNEENNFEIWVYEDVVVWNNFWVVFIVAAIFVIIHYLRFRIFESKRWMESNFDSPYITQYE